MPKLGLRRGLRAAAVSSHRGEEECALRGLRRRIAAARRRRNVREAAAWRDWLRRGASHVDGVYTSYDCDVQAHPSTLRPRCLRREGIHQMMDSEDNGGDVPEGGDASLSPRSTASPDDSAPLVSRAAEDIRKKKSYQDSNAALDAQIDEIQNQRDHNYRIIEEEQNYEDEERRKKEYVMEEIRNASSNADLLLKAELLIEEDWLGKVDALPGNLFYVAAFGSLVPEEGFSATALKTYTKLFGCLCIALVQLIGPPLIVLSKMPCNLGVTRAEAYQWRCWPLSFNPLYDPEDTEPCSFGDRLPADISLFEDWRHMATTKFMGIVFMLIFVLNALFVVQDEQSAFRSIYNTFRYLKAKTPNFEVRGGHHLAFGALMNNWVVIWSCLAVWLIAGASPTPKDLLMDSLGLLFLYNLDDIGGDLGFVDADDWPGERIGWIHDEIVKPCHGEDFDVDVLDTAGTCMLSVYSFVIGSLTVFVVAFPVMAVITPFVQISPSN